MLYHKNIYNKDIQEITNFVGEIENGPKRILEMI